MLNRSDQARYDRISIAFHWLTAALVMLLWLMAQSEALLLREWRHGMWSFHISAGATLVLIYCARLAWGRCSLRALLQSTPACCGWRNNSRMGCSMSFSRPL